MYLNKVYLIGNLTRDPELRSLPSGAGVCQFGLATNRTFKDKNGQRQEATEFHNVVVFGRQAETSAQYLKKGSSVLVEGRIQTRSWDDKDGQKKYRTEIVAERVQFGTRAGAGGSTGAVTGAPEPSAPSAAGGARNDDVIDYPEEEINPDDIPF